jgi:hypothetical protein
MRAFADVLKNLKLADAGSLSAGDRRRHNSFCSKKTKSP